MLGVVEVARVLREVLLADRAAAGLAHMQLLNYQ
jgi:hypothetical protein